MIVEILKKQISYNTAPRNGKIKYIVIHDTGNKSKGANASAHFNYFNGANRNSSADFFVDDAMILQVNDYEKLKTWHVGDGKGKYGITNDNSVGIEICVNEGADYEKAFLNAIRLTKFLMAKLNIPLSNVIRHFDASRKNCPASMSENNWKLWEVFKKKLTEDKNMAECEFKDIADCFAKEEIKELFNMGIVNGKTKEEFFPNEPITRAESAVVARNIIRYITGK